MHAVARRIVRDDDAADDVVQSALEKAWRAAPRFRAGSRPSTWLHRIVVNEALMWLRRERRLRARDDRSLHARVEIDSVAAPDASSLEALIAREQLQQLRRGWIALSSNDREILALRSDGPSSYEDYCARTGIGRGAAKTRAFRARRRLRALLEAAR